MAALQNSFVLTLLLSVNVGTASTDSNLDSLNACWESCYQTYTALNHENSESCKRGCRFYSIMEFINHNDHNATLIDCTSTCDEAYYNVTSEESNACKLGCEKQVVFSKVTQDSDQGEPTVHVLYPLLYMHSLYSDVIDKMYHHMEVTWSLFMEPASGQLVIVRSEPRIVFISDDMEDIGDKLPFFDGKTSGYLETNIASQDNSATPLLSYRQSQMGASHNMEDGLNMDVDDVTRSDWLTCVAKKTGIARIILCFLILACAIVMIWFCLTAVATAPEQHLSINGDLEYLWKMNQKDSFKLLHPQATVEARPLPVKIRVEQI